MFSFFCLFPERQNTSYINKKQYEVDIEQNI